MPPVSATLSAPSPLVAGSRYNVSCSALGSSPFVLYNWTLAGDPEPDRHVRIAGYRHWTLGIINKETVRHVVMLDNDRQKTLTMTDVAN